MYRLCFHPDGRFHAKKPAISFEEIWKQDALSTVTAYRTSDVCLIECPLGSLNGKPGTVYRKRYWYPALKGKLNGFFRNTFFGRSRAAVEFKNMNRLHAMGHSKVLPLAFGEERRLRLLCRAFILTEHVAETRSLDGCLKEETFIHAPNEERKVFLCALGRWVGRLHSIGYRDRDLFTRNILVHGTHCECSFSKIDSPKGSGGRLPPGHGSPYLKDLQDLDEDFRGELSRPDRLRCLLAYLGSGNLDEEVRGMAKRILQSRKG
jgi:hypothetical protein